MAIRKVRKTKAFERNANLTFGLMRYLSAHPDILRQLPKKFELVILPEDDPELTAYNVKLLQKYGSEEQPVVFVRMLSSRVTDFEKTRPEVYAPVAS
jgi:hypothetical protein